MDADGDAIDIRYRERLKAGIEGVVLFQPAVQGVCTEAAFVGNGARQRKQRELVVLEIVVYIFADCRGRFLEPLSGVGFLALGIHLAVDNIQH